MLRMGAGINCYYISMGKQRVVNVSGWRVNLFKLPTNMQIYSSICQDIALESTFSFPYGSLMEVSAFSGRLNGLLNGYGVQGPK